MPSSLDLSNTAAGLMTRLLGRVEALAGAIKSEGHRWDYILIDCPPDAGVLTLNALVAAQAVVIPAEPGRAWARSRPVGGGVLRALPSAEGGATIRPR